MLRKKIEKFSIKGLSEKQLVFTLLAINLSHVLDFVVLMPLGPKLMRDFSITAAEFGYLVSAYTFTAALSSFFGVSWLDRINRKTALLLLLCGFTMSNLICAYATFPSLLLLGRVLSGLFGGVINAVLFAFIGQLIPVKRRGRATGMLSLAFPLVSVVGIPIGLKIADSFGWRATFLFIVILSIGSIIASFLILPSLEPEHKNKDRFSLVSSVVNVVSVPEHRWALCTMFLVVLGGFTIVPYIAPFLVNNGHLAESKLFLMYLIGGIGSALSARLVGVLCDRWTPSKVLPFSVSLGIVGIIFFVLMPANEIFWVIVLTTFAMMAMPSRLICFMSWATIIADPKYRGSFMSLIMSAQQLAVGVATLIGGLIVSQGTNGEIIDFPLAGLFAICANIGILVLLKKFVSIEIHALTKHKTAR